MHEAQTAAEEGVWDVLTACDRQLRTGGMGQPFALDFGAVMQMGAARGVDVALLAEALPHAEAAIVNRLAGAEQEGE